MRAVGIIGFASLLCAATANPHTGKVAGEKAQQRIDSADHTIQYEGIDRPFVPKLVLMAGGKMPLAKVYAMGTSAKDVLQHPTESGASVLAIWVLSAGTTIFYQDFNEGDAPRGGFAVPQHLAHEHTKLIPYVYTSRGEIWEGEGVYPATNEHVRNVYGTNREKDRGKIAHDEL